jgi:ATP-dependent Lhr-like helicase
MISPLTPALNWYAGNHWQPFDFQVETWNAMLAGKSGLLNAPTGSGKTYAIWLGCLLRTLQKSSPDPGRGLKVIWITPLRALSTDIHQALDHAATEMCTGWTVDIRTGDTPSSARQRQTRRMPDCLITTPESLHVLLTHKNAAGYFEHLDAVIVDEWHELIGTKRGVQVELALSVILGIPQERPLVWGISATIGNLAEALDTLLGATFTGENTIIRASIEKQIAIESVFPDQIERYPWAGHIGIKMLPQVVEIIRKSNTTLLFTNTRSQTEIWYREILNHAPDLAGIMAMHHGSLDNNIRKWVELALQEGRLKVVVCTSSLDLGVDFRPVDTVIQVGGPKGVSRFMQRAGRSGHQPGALSRIFFVPTHALELIEGAALKTAVGRNIHENRPPLKRSLDVLIQFLVTMAVGNGFKPEAMLRTVRKTSAYAEITEEEWNWCLRFITTGGDSLSSYSEFSKVSAGQSSFNVTDRSVATRHRLSIGTIVEDPVLRVKYTSGRLIGTIEESFISMLRTGESFWFAGRCLELVRVRDLTAWVVKARTRKGRIPAWMGGRLPLSSKLSELIRDKLEESRRGIFNTSEMQVLQPLLLLQQKLSEIPSKNILLVEYIRSREGHHVYMYPFAGRFVHEVMGSLIAYRISRIEPITFSIAMNDYGFELLSDKPIPVEEALETDLFSLENLLEDLEKAINKSEMAKRKFRDIASISGLIFQGYPGKGITHKHLQSSSNILYQVFEQYDPRNLLLRQAREEVITLQIDYARFIHAMKEINNQQILLKYPEKFTPFSFPIMADRLREKLSSEKLADRILRLQQQLEKE